MENKYNLSEAQLSEIENYSDVFSDIETEIYNIKKLDEIDVLYGFELGKVFRTIKNIYDNESYFIDKIKDNDDYSEFYITEEQFDYLGWCCTQLQVQCEFIADLCSVERTHFEYGFVVGSMHSQLSRIKIELMLLTEQIHSQKNKEDDDKQELI